MFRVILFTTYLTFFWSANINAQYFGRNKPNYRQFDFKVLETPNFEIYHYLKNEELIQELANDAEHWYKLHQQIFKDTIPFKNPIIFYNNHADFQQTRAVTGTIEVGTGGVTEAFKNRVILPLAPSYGQTNHVLGHELVHAFQYNLILNGDSTNIKNLSNLPIWMVEGLAEYLSIGDYDRHTAMWMRDAILNKKIPSIDKLDNPQYFPYRWGHAFWAFLTQFYGNEIIAPFFQGVAISGLEEATKIFLGVSVEDLSKLWENYLRSHFGKSLRTEKEVPIGELLLSERNSGSINIAPSISPDGKYVIFLSEKDLFTIDLFLADTESGHILKKVASTLKDEHIDDFNYIESSGTWSPDSKQFAFAGISNGKNILIIKDVMSGKSLLEKFLPGLPEFTNPAWSPDGQKIIVTGMLEGQSDLFEFEIKSERIKQLTNDRFSEWQPSWSKDGKKIFFSTDRISIEKGKTLKSSFNLAWLDYQSLISYDVNILPGTDNLNPHEDASGGILFISNANLFRYDLVSNRLESWTDFNTGISGITPFAPAFSVSGQTNQIVYTHFFDGKYSVYKANPENFLRIPADLLATSNEIGALKSENPSQILFEPADISDQTIKVPFKPKFKLDYIGGSVGVGIGSGNTFGTATGAAGGIDMLFSDIVGNHTIFSSIAMNGEITDFGGAVAYLNQKSRINWGASISHIPFRSVRGNYWGLDTIPGTGGLLADRYLFELTRVFEDRAGIFAQLPFSTTLRLQTEATYSRYSYRIEEFQNYYDSFGNLIWQEREKLDAPPGFNLYNINIYLVGDNSYFGLTAPLQGYRFRVGIEQYAGEFNFTALSADYRIYKFIKPISLAFRLFHFGRYGKNSEDLFPLYLGSPWFVRGYNSYKIEPILIYNEISFYQLMGSKLLVSNVELRIPFFGPEKLAWIGSNYFFTDLNFFIDGGLAWNNFNQFSETEARPFFSTGVSLRINLFGAMILEPYYAYPLLKNASPIVGLNIIPGW